MCVHKTDTWNWCKELQGGETCTDVDDRDFCGYFANYRGSDFNHRSAQSECRQFAPKRYAYTALQSAVEGAAWNTPDRNYLNKYPHCLCQLASTTVTSKTAVYSTTARYSPTTRSTHPLSTERTIYPVCFTHSFVLLCTILYTVYYNCVLW